MDGETTPAVTKFEEFERVLLEFDMLDFDPETRLAKGSMPETDLISSSPEWTLENSSSDSTLDADWVSVLASEADGIEDALLEPEAFQAKPNAVSALLTDSVVPIVEVVESSSASTLGMDPVPDSALVMESVSNTAWGTEEVHALGASLSGSVAESTGSTDSDGIYMIPDADWITSRDALLADLESTSSNISKQAVFFPEETPYSYPTGSDCYQEVSSPPRLTSPPAQTLNGTLLEKPESAQSLSSVQKSFSPRVSESDEEHVYSFPNKQKTIDSPAAVMSSSLGSNLSELDRLLLELNAVQHSTPSFPTEEAHPPKLASNTQRYVPENGVSSVVKAPPPKMEKPKRHAAGRGVEDVRPSMESLLNELESSVPAPAPAPSVPKVSELKEVHEETPAQQQARISASSATRELDELMASLSDFKVQSNIMAQGKSSPTSVPKQGNKLDNMLGNLQSDLNRLGVQTVAKGVCGACKKPIAGQVVTAMGRTWHPEHFVCTHCQEEIGSKNFFERDGQPYCEKDYHSLFSPRCYYCNGPILDRVVTALDKTWHPEHFFCAQCGSFFGPEGFHEKEGKAYCKKDYFDMFAPKCGGCARAILENYISALNSLWHPECFVCRVSINMT
ncbi:paxillin a isoform X2 [Myxocyprinus asiaticus]|uniref:paxillin a isoform X2 n=1 Tax=Myxocyprinus asiaticus TaxID=70543 RepID=UPI002223A6E6|nr:paxillin a isoform X2 [Myxocyprinus asiaticus]